jgi:hypothetical protein
MPSDNADDRDEPTMNHTARAAPDADRCDEGRDDRYPTDSDDDAPSGVTPGGDEVPTEPAAIRRAFDEAAIPFVDADAEIDVRGKTVPAKELVRNRWPAAVRGERVPDPHYHHRQPVLTLEVPPWALAAVAEQVETSIAAGRIDDRADAEAYVVGFIDDCLEPQLRYRTPGGADAIDAVLAAVGLDEERDADDEPEAHR